MKIPECATRDASARKKMKKEMLDNEIDIDKEIDITQANK